MRRRLASLVYRRYRGAIDYFETLDEDEGWRTTRMWNRRVHSQKWLAKFGAAALPYALEMLHSPAASAREDAAWVLEQIGSRPGVVEELLAALERETDQVAIDSTVMALGGLRDRRAVPALGRMLRNPAVDGDTRSLVVDSLGRIARRRFDRAADPEAAALEWADAQADET